MAEDVVSQPITLDGSVDSAASAILGLLKEPSPEPVEDAAPEPEPASWAQGHRTASSTEEPNTVEEAAPADTPDSQPQGAEPQPQTTTPAPAPAPALQAAQQGNDLSTVQQTLQNLTQIVPVLQSQLAQAFPDIQSQDDLIRLAQTDPGRVVAYNAAREKVQTAVNAQAQVQADYRNAWTRAESAKLQTLIPEIADPSKGPALQAKLRDYAKECGYTDRQIEWAASSDVNLLYQAMMFRDSKTQSAEKEKSAAAELAAAKAKAASAPPVQKPGMQRTTTSREEKNKETFERLQKTGHISDAAAVFRSIL